MAGSNPQNQKKTDVTDLLMKWDEIVIIISTGPSEGFYGSKIPDLLMLRC